MLSLKKTTVAILALGSSAVFAGTMGPVCTPGNVTVPCASRAWDVGGQALYFQTMTDNRDTFVDVTSASLSENQAAQWNWGFQIEGSYHFNTGNDVTLSWYHIDTSWRNSGFVVAEPVPPVLTDAVTFGHKNRWDAVNGEFGQFVDFSANKKVRFHGGFQFASIKRSAHSLHVDTAEIVINDLPVSIDRAQQNRANNEYNGFGPRTGADFNYMLTNNFGIYAKAAAVLLVGTAKSSRNDGLIVTLNDEDPTSLFTYNSRSKTALVPELESKLGVTGTYAVGQGDLTADVGYMWFNYFNVLHAAGRDRNVSDFAAAGVYFGLKYVG